MTTSTADMEPYGTTPLPIVSSTSPVHVTMDVSALYRNSSRLQVPQVSPIAGFDATKLPGQSIDVNRHFLLYAVKNGLIRVLHKSGAPLKHLLRGHSGQQLRDLTFFQDGDILGTVGVDNSGSKLLVWRVLERSPEIKADVLLEISSNMEMIGMHWHPFNPNLFLLRHKNANNGVVATLVETTRIATVPSSAGHAVCQFHQPHVIMDGAIQLVSQHGNQDMTDLCWSDRDTKHVLTSFTSHLVLWDIHQSQPDKNADGTKIALTLAVIDLTRVSALGNNCGSLSRCFFVPYDDSTTANGRSANGTALTSCFVTGQGNNSKIVLWGPVRKPPTSPSSTSTADLIQVIELETSNSSGEYLVDGCFVPSGPGGSPPPGFLIVADTNQPRLLALHCKSAWGDSNNQEGGGPTPPLLSGCDYVVPFANKEPIYSMKCVTITGPDLAEPPNLSSEDDNDQGNGGGGGAGGGGVPFDMQVYAYQAKNTQCLTLTSYMCLPPEHTYVDPTPGVQVRRLYHDVPSAHVSDVGDVDDEDDDNDLQSTELQFDEVYEVEEEDDDDDLDGPEPSALPPPQGFASKEAPAAVATPPASSNPFANWLGAIAAKTSGAPVVPPPPPVPVPPRPPTTHSSGPIASDAMSEVSTGSSTPPPFFQALPVPPPPPPPELGSIPLAEGPDAPPPPLPPVTPSFLSPLDILGPTKPPLEPMPPQASASRASKTPPKTAASSKTKSAPPKAGMPTQPPPPPPVAVLSRSTPPENASATVVTSDEASSLRAVVQEELEAALVPALQKALQAAVLESVLPLQASVDQIRKMQQEAIDAARAAADAAAQKPTAPASMSVDPDVLMAAVEAPLKACVASHVKAVWIPALDSLASQVLSQVSSHLETSRREQVSARSPEMDAISTQLSTMTALVTKLTSEVQGLRTAVAAQQQQSATAAALAGHAAGASASPPPTVTAPSVPAADPASADAAVRARILSLLRESKYEAAFTTAVTTGTGDNSMAVFCCLSADVSTVLGGGSRPPALSQPILLCLLQQLGTSLLNLSKRDVSLELLWLQEIALSLDPSNAQIHPHVAGVLQQLVAGINARMGANDPSLRRPLQRLLQVVRGMQMG